MGRNKNCVYPTCNSDSRRFDKPHMFGVSFIPFPKPITKPVLCFKWLKWLKEVRKDFTKNKITKSSYLCSKHFVGSNGPTDKYPHPVHPNSMVSVLKPLSTSLAKVQTSQSDVKQPITSEEPTQSTNALEQNKSSELGNPFSNSEKDHSVTTPEFEDQISLNTGQMTTDNNAEFTTLTENFQHNVNQNKTDDPNLLNNAKMITQNNPYKEILDSPEWLNLVKDNWLSNLSYLKNSKLLFLKINKDTKVSLISITVNEDYSVEGKIFEKDLANHNLVELPETISSANGLMVFLTYINRFKICQGIKEANLIKLLKARSRGKFTFEVIRDDNCMGLSNNKTCFHCTRLRSYALKTIAESKKISNCRKYKSLSKEELITMLKKSKAGERKARRKVKQEQIFNDFNSDDWASKTSPSKACSNSPTR